VEAVAQLGWSFTGRSNEGLTVEARRGRFSRGNFRVESMWKSCGKAVGNMMVLYKYIEIDIALYKTYLIYPFHKT